MPQSIVREPAHFHVAAMPDLSAGEWRDVQRAVRAVGGIECPKTGARTSPGEPSMVGPIHRGLARIGHLMPNWRRPAARPIAPELQPLRNFLCEHARHGPGIAAMAAQLQAQGYTPAQIAALSFIAG